MSKVKLSPEIITQLKHMGCKQDGNSWIVDNVKYEFDICLHMSCYINNIYRQGYTGAEKILRVLIEQTDAIQ